MKKLLTRTDTYWLLYSYYVKQHNDIAVKTGNYEILDTDAVSRRAHIKAVKNTWDAYTNPNKYVATIREKFKASRTKES